MKINWKEKLTSRKFWASVIGFITAILTVFAIPDIKIEQVIGVVTAVASLIAYTIGEGLVDASKNNEIKTETKTEENKVE